MKGQSECHIFSNLLNYLTIVNLQLNHEAIVPFHSGKYFTKMKNSAA